MTITGTSLHTQLFSAIVRSEHRKFRPLTAKDFNPPAAVQGIPTLLHPTLGLEVVQEDYEVQGRPKLIRQLIAIMHDVLPFNDRTEGWTSPDEARRLLDVEFSNKLGVRIQWPDPVDPSVVAMMATTGIASHLLEATANGGYQVDFSDMAAYQVRPRFQRYGARLLLNRDLSVDGIDWQGGIVRPDAPTWANASLVFRSSIAVAVTVRDHAMKCHMIGANAFLVATRRHLPPSHPVRQLLAPFQFRTAIINRGALVTLVGKRALFNRLWAFEWDSLVRYYHAAQASFRMETLPAELARKGVSGLAGYAYSEDGLEFWSCLERYVDRFLGHHIAAGPLVDRDLQRWWECIKLMCRDALPATTRDDLVKLCTWLLYLATAYHAQVGSFIGDNIANLAMAPANVRKGSTLAEMLPSRDTYAQSYMLGVLTTFPVPKLMEDFSWIYRDDADRQAVKALHTELAELALRIDERNSRRRIPFLAFHPRSLDISVSI